MSKTVARTGRPRRDAGSRGREREGGSLPGLAAVLTLFVLVGGAAAVFIWHVLNELLTGHLPGMSGWAVAGLLALFAGLIYSLGRYLHQR